MPGFEGPCSRGFGSAQWSCARAIRSTARVATTANGGVPERAGISGWGIATDVPVGDSREPTLEPNSPRSHSSKTLQDRGAPGRRATQSIVPQERPGSMPSDVVTVWGVKTRSGP
jgi:hypothetical protein